jgi:hypothetical protein
MAARPRLRVGCPCGWRGYRVQADSRPCPAPGCDTGPERIEVMWPAGQGPHLSIVYVLHFRWPLRLVEGELREVPPSGFHARHYCGATRDLPQRLRDHRLGRGARLVAAAVAAGAGVELVRVWRVPLAFERRLKQRRPYSESPRTRKGVRRGCATSLVPLCPDPGCGGEQAWGRYSEARVRAGYQAEREAAAAARQARHDHLARCDADRAAGVWDPVAAWPADWDRLFPTAA